MDALLIIALVCFFALFVAALAIARHVRIVKPRHDSPQFSLSLSDHRAERTSIAPISRHPAEQNVHKLVEHKEPDWRYLISGERRGMFSRNSVSPATRKPPESTRLSLNNRPIWNSDPVSADLSDPYTRFFTKQALTGGSRTH